VLHLWGHQLGTTVRSCERHSEQSQPISLAIMRASLELPRCLSQLPEGLWVDSREVSVPVRSL